MKLNKRGWILIICIILFGLFIFSLFINEADKKEKIVGLENSSIDVIKNGLEMYHVYFDEYPYSLDDMEKKLPEGFNQFNNLAIKINKPTRAEGDIKLIINHFNTAMKNLNDLTYYIRKSDYQAYKITYRSIDGQIKVIEADFTKDLQKTN